MKIGVFGGTFDPVHTGHIISAVEVKHALKLDKLIFIPARRSPHKYTPTDQTDRLNMLKSAVAPFDFITVDTFELDNEAVSYTYNTVKYLNSKYDEDQLYFLIGTDQFQNFKKWYKYDALLEMIHFVVMRRSDESINIEAPFIEVLQPIIEISSSLIRTRIQNQEEYRHLLPENVYGYIKENNLYGS
jgi:nicotinate-nucleotide adenylyltransferase